MTFLSNLFEKPINSYLPKGIDSWEDLYLGEKISSFVPETVEQAKAIVQRARIASMDLRSQHRFQKMRLRWTEEKMGELQLEIEEKQKEIIGRHEQQ